MAGIAYVLHYLDDVFVINKSKDTCQDKMTKVRSLSSFLGIPINQNKVISPDTKLPLELRWMHQADFETSIRNTE